MGRFDGARHGVRFEPLGVAAAIAFVSFKVMNGLKTFPSCDGFQATSKRTRLAKRPSLNCGGRAPWSNGPTFDFKKSVVDRIVALMTLCLAKAVDEHAERRENPEELEVLFFIELSGDLVQALIRECQKHVSVRVPAAIVRLGEDVWRELIAEIDKRQAFRLKVTWAHRAIELSISIDRDFRFGTWLWLGWLWLCANR